MSRTFALPPEIIIYISNFLQSSKDLVNLVRGLEPIYPKIAHNCIDWQLKKEYINSNNLLCRLPLDAKYILILLKSSELIEKLTLSDASYQIIHSLKCALHCTSNRSLIYKYNWYDYVVYPHINKTKWESIINTKIRDKKYLILLDIAIQNNWIDVIEFLYHNINLYPVSIILYKIWSHNSKIVHNIGSGHKNMKLLLYIIYNMYINKNEHELTTDEINEYIYAFEDLVDSVLGIDIDSGYIWKYNQDIIIVRMIIYYLGINCSIYHTGENLMERIIHCIKYKDIRPYKSLLYSLYYNGCDTSYLTEEEHMYLE